MPYLESGTPASTCAFDPRSHGAAQQHVDPCEPVFRLFLATRAHFGDACPEAWSVKVHSPTKDVPKSLPTLQVSKKMQQTSSYSQRVVSNRSQQGVPSAAAQAQPRNSVNSWAFGDQILSLQETRNLWLYPWQAAAVAHRQCSAVPRCRAAAPPASLRAPHRRPPPPPPRQPKTAPASSVGRT